MSSIFSPIPEYLNCFSNLTKEPYGKWALLLRDLPVKDNCGFKRLDIVYVFNEQIATSLINNLKPRDIKYLENKNTEEYIRGEILEKIMYNSNDSLIYDIANNKNITLRAYEGELNLNQTLTEQKELISEAYDIVHYTAGNITENNKIDFPIGYNEPITEIIQSLQLDGFSVNEAVMYVLDNNMIDSPKLERKLSGYTDKNKTIIMKNSIPNYYYSIKPEYYHQFTI